MNDANRKTTLVLSLIAASAAIAAVSYLYWWRLRAGRNSPPSLRGVNDILTECYAKMRDIQADLGQLPVASARS